MTDRIMRATRGLGALGASLALGLLAPDAFAQTAMPGDLAPDEIAKAEEERAREEGAKSYPRITGGVSIEVEDDYTFDSDDNTAEINDLYNTTEAALSLEFSEATRISASLTFEPIRDPGPNDDREFEDQGLYLEELYLFHDFGPASAVAGKFNPAFGFAWDIAPGLFGTDFAEDYELTEKIGGGVAIPFTLGGGEAALVVAAYMADRTVFSDSLGANRGNLDEKDGGVSNTDAPESFMVALTGENAGVDYNLGIRRQAKGKGDDKDEFGFVAGAHSAFGDMGIEGFGEIAYFPNFEGTRDDAFYTSLGVAAPVGPVTLSAVYSLRDSENAPTDHLATVSAEYEIVEGFSVGAGYRYAREGKIDNHTVGAVFAYEFSF